MQELIHLFKMLYMSKSVLLKIKQQNHNPKIFTPMNSLHLQEKLRQLTSNRASEIRDMYPTCETGEPEIFSLNHQFECRRIVDINAEIQAQTSFFVVNIRGFMKSNFFRHKLPLSDYETFTANLEYDKVSLSCGNWYAEAAFEGDNVKDQLIFHLCDNEDGRLTFKPKENFYFADAFNHFYHGVSDYSTRYKTLKLFKSNKNYAVDELRLKTGFVSRETPASRKFFTDTDKYYKNKLGIGRK